MLRAANQQFIIFPIAEGAVQQVRRWIFGYGADRILVNGNGVSIYLRATWLLRQIFDRSLAKPSLRSIIAVIRADRARLRASSMRRLKRHVAAKDASAQRASDINKIPGSCTGSCHGKNSSTSAKNCDRQRQSARPGRGIAADDGAVKWIGRFAKTKIKFFGVFKSTIGRQSRGGDSGDGQAGHRRAIGKVPIHYLPADCSRGMDCTLEMNPIQHLINPHQEQIGSRPFQDGKVIADSDLRPLAGSLLCTKPFQEVGFASHGEIVRMDECNRTKGKGQNKLCYWF